MPAMTGECSELRRTLDTGVMSIAFTWESDASGDVQYNLETPLRGNVWKLVTDPVGAPTDQYNIVFEDDDGADVLMGRGADRSDTDVETAYIFDFGDPSSVSHIDGLGIFKVDSAGNATHGVAIVYLKPLDSPAVTAV